MNRGLLFITLISIPVIMYGQGKLLYDSAYAIRPGVVGEAEFNYELGPANEIWRQGPFHFIYNDLNTSGDSLELKGEEWEGEFRNDRKIGRWRYTYRQYSLRVTGVEENALNYSGIRRDAVLKANYDKGRPTGTWTYINTRKGRDGDELIEEEFQVNFEEGRLSGDVFCTMRTDLTEVVVTGQAEDGLFSGDWTFEYSDGLEWRQYEKGVLRILLLTSGEDTLSLIHFPLSEQIKKAIVSEEEESGLSRYGSLNFRDGYPTSSELVGSQQRGNGALRKMMNILLQNDVGFLDQKNYPLSTSRMKYPLSAEERMKLKACDSLFSTYKDILEKFEREQVKSFMFSKDKFISLIVSWLQQEEAVVLELEKHIGQDLFSSMEHTNRTGLILDSTRSSLSTVAIRLKEDSLVVNYDKNGKADDLIDYFLFNLQGRIAVADSLHDQYLIRIKSMHLDNALLLKNEKIIEMIDQLDSSIKADVRDPSLNRLIERVHDHYLLDIVNEEYQQFLSEVDDKKHQAILGDSLLLELSVIEDIYEELHQIADRRRDIDELYTEYVFDPFTFTDQVPTRLKRRLYDLIAVQMFNQMVERATASRDPFQCHEVLEELYDQQSALYELREKDTRKLEGRLKRNKELDERIRILHEAL